MSHADPTTSGDRRDALLACGIIFFALTLLCLLLGGAEGVRQGTRYLHIPETGICLVIAAILGCIGAFFLLWSRGLKR